MRYYALLLVVLTACSTGVQVREEDHVVAADTVDGVGYPQTLHILKNPECDTAEVLLKFGQAVFEAHDQMIYWRSKFATEREASLELRDSTGRLVATIDRLKRNVHVRVETQTQVIHDIDTVQVVRVQEYGFWMRVRDYTAFLVAGMVLGIIAFAFLRK